MSFEDSHFCLQTLNTKRVIFSKSPRKNRFISRALSLSLSLSLVIRTYQKVLLLPLRDDVKSRAVYVLVSLSFSFALPRSLLLVAIGSRRERITREWNSSPPDWRIRSFFIWKMRIRWVCKNANRVDASVLTRRFASVFLSRAKRRKRRKPTLSRRVERRSLSLSWMRTVLKFCPKNSPLTPPFV